MHEKKRTNFHHFIGFNECFYLNLQSISIALVKKLKRIGLAFTITDVGAEIGIPLMNIGGYINLGAKGLTAISYLYEKKYSKFLTEGGKMAIEIGVDKLTGNLIKPVGKLGINRELGKGINGVITSEVTIPALESQTKTVN